MLDAHCGNGRGRETERFDVWSLNLQGHIHAVQGAAGGAHPGADALAMHADRVMPRMLDLVGKGAAGRAAEQQQQADGQRASQNPCGELSLFHLNDEPIDRPQSYSSRGLTSNIYPSGVFASFPTTRRRHFPPP